MTGPILDQPFLMPDLARARFPKTSRYHLTGTAVHIAADGTPVLYLQRRFPPHPETLETIGTYVARPSDRRDLAADAALGRPDLWWRLADGAGATDPDTIVDQPGTAVRLTLDPEGGG